MKLKRLRADQGRLAWPADTQDIVGCLPALTGGRPLVLVSGFVSGFIHDVSSFLGGHASAQRLLHENIGRDATTASHGGVHDHPNAAHNLLAIMKGGALHGGLEQESEKAIPPSQKLRILRAGE